MLLRNWQIIYVQKLYLFLSQDIRESFFFFILDGIHIDKIITPRSQVANSQVYYETYIHYETYVQV